MEALVRAHLTLAGSDEEVKQLQADDYRVNFKEIGPRIDKALGLEGLLERVLTGSRVALHSYTHAGRNAVRKAVRRQRFESRIIPKKKSQR